MPLAATPAWFADNIAPVSLVTLALLTFAVLRMVQKATTRFVLVVLIVAVAAFVIVNRVQLEACARTCECRVVRQDVEVPLCNPDLQLSSAPVVPG